MHGRKGPADATGLTNPGKPIAADIYQRAANVIQQLMFADRVNQRAIAGAEDPIPAPQVRQSVRSGDRLGVREIRDGLAHVGRHPFEWGSSPSQASELPAPDGGEAAGKSIRTVVPLPG
jgi:hypothetical protein